MIYIFIIYFFAILFGILLFKYFKILFVAPLLYIIRYDSIKMKKKVKINYILIKDN